MITFDSGGSLQSRRTRVARSTTPARIAWGSHWAFRPRSSGLTRQSLSTGFTSSWRGQGLQQCRELVCKTQPAASEWCFRTRFWQDVYQWFNTTVSGLHQRFHKILRVTSNSCEHSYNTRVCSSFTIFPVKEVVQHEQCLLLPLFKKEPLRWKRITVWFFHMYSTYVVFLHALPPTQHHLKLS